jgi:hypothetical protein
MLTDTRQERQLMREKENPASSRGRGSSEILECLDLLRRWGGSRVLDGGV